MSKIGQHVLRAKRQAHRWFEFGIGLVYMVAAACCISVALDKWRIYLDHPQGGLGLFYLFAAFSLLLIFCCLYSFLKARSIR
ncbi:MAG: hypothetical protein ACRD1N_05965 [Terriglobia bacterium]